MKWHDFDVSNTRLLLQLLSALLPALRKYNCLIFIAPKPRRSPWVRAFCDLYHPAGPWGSNKFSNTPDITSQRKYNFKSYQIPMLYKQLTKRNDTATAVRRELKTALEEYFQKEVWQNQFLEGCKMLTAVEVNKAMAARAPIPTAENGFGRAAAVQKDQSTTTVDMTVQKDQSTTTADLPLEDEAGSVNKQTAERSTMPVSEDELGGAPSAAPIQDHDTTSTAVGDTAHDGKTSTPPTPSRRRRKRECNDEVVERPRTRARARKENGKVGHEKEAVAQAATAPTDETESFGEKAHSKETPTLATHDAESREKNEDNETSVSNIESPKKNWEDGEEATEQASVSPRGTETPPNNLNIEETVVASTRAASSPAAAVTRQPVTPEASTTSSKAGTKAALEERRAELEKMLARRRGSNSSGNDIRSQKLQAHIDKVDDELLELILA
jgi:hypothetical protein